MGDRGVQRQRDRRDFGRRAKPEIDTLHVSVGGPLLQQLYDPPPGAHGRFTGLVTRSPRQRIGIEQNLQHSPFVTDQQIDVGRVIELVAAELTHGDDRKGRWFGIRNAFANGRIDGAIDRRIGEVGQQPRDVLQRKLTRKVPERHRKRESVALPTKFRLQILGFCRKREFRGSGRAVAQEDIRDWGKRLQRLAQKWRMALGAPQRILS